MFSLAIVCKQNSKTILSNEAVPHEYEEISISNKTEGSNNIKLITNFAYSIASEFSFIIIIISYKLVFTNLYTAEHQSEIKLTANSAYQDVGKRP